MPIADYAHHNEEAEQIWWLEKGQWADEPDQWDGDPGEDRWADYECQNGPEECIEAGNFDGLPDGLWCCSTCGNTIVRDTPNGYVLVETAS